MSLMILFENGTTMVVSLDEPGEFMTENMVLTKPSDVGRTLTATISTYHRVQRGKVLGIKNKLYYGGQLVKVSDIASLPTVVEGYVWQLEQKAPRGN